MKFSFTRKKIVALILIFAVIALSTGVYFWKVKADSAAAAGVKVQLVDLSGKEVKAGVVLEMLVYGKARVCQRVTLAGIKVTQCKDQDRAYTRYAATDENGSYVIPSNIGKPLTDTELRDTLQKVVYSSGQTLESDDVQDIIDNVKNIKVDDNPTFLMQAVQVVGSAYAAKFAGDLVSWTANQINKMGVKKSPTTAASSSTGTSGTQSSTGTGTSTTTNQSQTGSTTGGSTSTTSTVLEGTAQGGLAELGELKLSINAGKQEPGPLQLSTSAVKEESTGILTTAAAAGGSLPKIKLSLTPKEVKNISTESLAKANANIALGVQQLAPLDKSSVEKASQIVLGAIKPGSKAEKAFHSNLSMDKSTNIFTAFDAVTGEPIPGKVGITNINDAIAYVQKNINSTDATARDAALKLTMYGISAVGRDKTLTDSMIKQFSDANLSTVYTGTTGAEAPFKSGSRAAGLGNNIWNAVNYGTQAGQQAEIAQLTDNASKIPEVAPEKIAQVLPNLTDLSLKPELAYQGSASDSKTKKKNTIKSVFSGMFKSVVQSSISAGAFIIPDPVSLGIALIYQAIGPRYEVIESNFRPSNAVVSTLSERFDSGRIRIDFPASGASNTTATKSSGNSTGVLQYFSVGKNATSTGAAKKLQVVFRDEAVYNNTATSFLAKAFETTTNGTSRDYMTKTLSNYKDYLLETQLRGAEDANANTTITDSIKKIGNYACPAPATATTPAQ